MLAPLKSTDSSDVTRKKINEVARYIETFAVRRSINFRKFGASSIRYTMYTLVKELRGKDSNDCSARAEPISTELLGVFATHGANRRSKETEGSPPRGEARTCSLVENRAAETFTTLVAGADCPSPQEEIC